MPTNDIDNQIRAHVEAFVAEMTELVRSAALASVHEALAGSGLAAPARRGPGRPRKKAGRKRVAKRATRRAGAKAVGKKGRKGKKGKRIRRSAEDLAEAGQAILLIVKDNPGIRSEDIRKSLGVDAKDLKRPIDMLLASGKLRTEGQKRGTKYFAGRGGGTRKRTTKKKTARKTTKKRGGRKKTTKRAAKRAKKATKRVTKKKAAA